MDVNGDRLKVIFDMQAKLDEDIRARRDLHFTREEWVQKGVLAMVSELSEVLDEVNFKWWKNKEKFDEKALQEELIDVLHFFVSMCIHSGMDSDKLFELYMIKNEENFKRQLGTSEKQGYAANKQS